MNKLLFSTLLILLCGCASLRSGESGILQRMNQSANLSSAKEKLNAGNRTAAIKILTEIVSSGVHTGITDEALFMLAMLSIHPAVERDSNIYATKLLVRLKKEYPESQWTSQSEHLLELLNGIEDIRRQVKILKSSNQSLNQDVNELNKSIEQLKRLDKELEKRRRQ